MGNYYSGMINNKFGYGELRHGRTKGSRNGYSTTPGYVAIGKKAQGPKEKQSQARSFSNVLGRIGTWFVDNARKNPRIDALYRVQQFGKSKAPEVKRYTEDAHRSHEEEKARNREETRALRATTYGPDRHRGMNLRVDTDPESNYEMVTPTHKNIMRETAQKISDDAKKENKLYIKSKTLEKLASSMVKQYEGFLKKGKYEEAEKLLPKIQERYDAFKAADLEYREFKNSSNNWKLMQNLNSDLFRARRKANESKTQFIF